MVLIKWYSVEVCIYDACTCCLVSGVTTVVAALVEAAVVCSELLLRLLAHRSLVSAGRRRGAGVALHAEKAALTGAWSEATTCVLRR